MKKDIIFHPVVGIQVAIVRKFNTLQEAEWEVILINQKAEAISNVFVTSKGYGTSSSGDVIDQKTSTLRHSFPEIAPGQFVVVEPILEALFHLYNEYWVSFFVGNKLFDKKFIFVPDSIVVENIIKIESLGLEGVLHD